MHLRKLYTSDGVFHIVIAMSGQADLKLKMVLIGDPMVGKTSLVRRYVLDEFSDDYLLTLGVKVMKTDAQVINKHSGKEENVVMLLWDLMGQKHFRIIESVVFENVVGALVVCDLTNKVTLEHVDYWIDALFNITGKIPVILLANKNDLQDQADFGEKELKEMAAKYGADSYFTSALTGEHVDLSLIHS